MTTLVFLASGNGGTLKFVKHAIQAYQLDWQISGIIADRDCGALDFAAKSKVPARKITYTREVPEALRNALMDFNPDFIITNIHKIIDTETLDLYPNRFINLHYSLLPAFKGTIGMKTIDQAQKLNTQFVGATCHLVAPEVDSGKIISQSVIPVSWSLNKKIVMDLVFRSACLVLLNSLGMLTRDISNLSYDCVRYLATVIRFNPSLTFDPNRLNETFWTHLKNC